MINDNEFEAEKKNRSHIDDIYGPSPRHGHQFTK